MKIYSVISILFFAFSVKAEVILVEDSSTRSGIYMAKVISKTPILEKVSYLATKKHCERYHGTTHYSNTYMGSSIIAKTEGSTKPICNIVTQQDYHTVIKGYQVTYDFKGTLKSATLQYEPSEFVQVYSAIE
jgi:hypothetical protein